MTTTILVLSSNPRSQESYLALNKEYSEIEKARDLSQNKYKYSVIRVQAANIDDLQREVLDTKARIVHFCGHGLGRQGLVLETDLGVQQLISTQALAGLFKLLVNQVECLIFNACFSDAQAAVIGKHINYVIGTRHAIRDEAAIAFSKGFYTALFSGEKVESAYEFSKNRIQQEFYNSKNQSRKLVSLNSEGEELEEKEIFTFQIKNPLNEIESEPELQKGRNITVKQGNYIENIEGNYIVYQIEPVKITNKPSNLKKTGVVNFVGRERKLKELHELLQKNEQVTISAIAGMGGIGKTELAIQYARAYQDDYPGSLCWFSVSEQNLATQIIEFAATYLNLFAPDQLTSEQAKVEYCWQNWRSEKSLIILDNVRDYGAFYREKIAPYLPSATSNIKVLMTSRERPGSNISRIDLDVLTENAALELLENLIGESRITAEPDLAKELCKWLGYLPLGLELVGRYLALDENLTIEKTLKRLERKKLKARALLDPQQADMNAQLGVAAAFDLSWDVLSSEAQEIACYLSLFSTEPFEWKWVEDAWFEEEDEEQIEVLEELRNRQLINRSLLKTVVNKRAYQLHALIAQYLRAKLEERENAVQLKQKFCQPLIAIAKSIPETPTQQEIQAVSLAIPHLITVATGLIEQVDDEMLICPFVGLGSFYKGQGIYNQAEFWYESSLKRCRQRLGREHLDVTNSLNNLAELYKLQGRYEEAEPFHLQALELYRKLLGQEHTFVATSLNNLAALYDSQGRYEEAEPLYLQALEMKRKLLGQEHPDVATSLNNLATLYDSQGRYEEAEPLYFQALEMRRKLLGQEHPFVANSLNNLAGLYKSQRRYEEAEPLYRQALAIVQAVLGENHPNTKIVRENLESLP